MVHLQDDDCIYSYSMVCCTYIGTGRLVGRRVCSVLSVEHIKKLKIKILFYEMCILLVYAVQLYFV